MAQPRIAQPSATPGTPLSERDFQQGKVITIPWKLEARYAWDAGVALSRYLNAFKEGRILGSRCPSCKRTVVPPRTFCELCFRPMAAYVELQDTGTVNTFSLCYVTWDMQRLKEPIIPAVIEIDGASRGMGIMHLLGEVDPQAVRVGMRVRAVWKPPRQRTGAVTDIRYWKPE